MKKINLIKSWPVLLVIGLLNCQPEQTSKKVVEDSSTAVITSVMCGSSGASSESLQNLPAPAFRTGMGSSHLAITTTHPEAQKWFDLGINLLHDFWHLEAYRVFKEVIKADPFCAMGYWGLAMCQPGFGGENNTEWLNAIRKAESLQNNTSTLEKRLIEATSLLTEKGIRTAAPAFKKCSEQFPDNPEVLAFAAIVLRQTIQNQQDSDTLKLSLETALKRFPKHIGLQHYYVHLMELRPDFIQAKAIVEKMATATSHVPHLQHMPGHLYFLEGNYAKAVDVFTKVRQQELAYHKAEQIPLVADQNYMHNMHYLTVALAELGQKEKALEAAQSYAHITLTGTTPLTGPALMLLYEGRILPALVCIRYRDFRQAEEILSFWLNSFDVPLQSPLVRTYLEAMQAYCRGMAAIEKGNIPEASAYGMKLTQLMKTFEQQGLQKQQTADFNSINETYDILSMARYELAGWIDNINPNQPFNDMAWKEALDLEKAIHYDEPPRLMYPISESLGRLHLLRKDKTKAKEAFNSALKKRPNSIMIKQLMR